VPFGVEGLVEASPVGQSGQLVGDRELFESLVGGFESLVGGSELLVGSSESLCSFSNSLFQGAVELGIVEGDRECLFFSKPHLW